MHRSCHRNIAVNYLKIKNSLSFSLRLMRNRQWEWPRLECFIMSLHILFDKLVETTSDNFINITM